MAKFKKKIPGNSINPPAPVRTYPAISVIIPLYNVERYVSECLDSLLAQTFQEFEVIVVDDCSTDNSAAVVEGYKEKFGKRLTLTKTKKNSGGAGLPRNKGIELSRGEYLSFIDPDDTIAPTAFEKLYAYAKNTNADVVHCEKWYPLSDELYHDVEARKNLKPYSWPAKEQIFITKPFLLTNELEKRLFDFSKGWLTWSTCLQLMRRDFIISNEIKFINVFSEDLIFTIFELCCAEKYLVVPDVFYFYRMREGSAVHAAFDVPKLIQKYSLSLKHGIPFLKDFLDEHEFFSSKTDLKYVLCKMFFNIIFSRLSKVYEKTPAYVSYGLLQKEFSGDKNSDLLSYLLSVVNIYRSRVPNAYTQLEKFKQAAMQTQKRLAELEEELKQLRPEE